MCSIKTDFINKNTSEFKKSNYCLQAINYFCCISMKMEKKNKLQIEAVVYRCFKSNGWIKKTHIRRDKKMGIE